MSAKDISSRRDTRKFDALETLVAQAARAGLDVPVLESGPPMDRIVPGGEGADEQIEHWVSTLPRLGKLGVKVICYNFMPQMPADKTGAAERSIRREAERGDGRPTQGEVRNCHSTARGVWPRCSRCVKALI
jgi:D-mannonate dehydratase